MESLSKVLQDNNSLIRQKVEKDSIPQTVMADRLDAAAQFASDFTEAKAPSISPEMFGARGDGESDDTGAINDMISEAVTKKISCVVKSGTYLIDPITLPSNVHMKGVDGPVFKLKDSSANDRQVFKVAGNTSNITFENIEFDANREGNSGSNIVAVFVGETSTGTPIDGVAFRNCTFKNSKDRALLWLRGFELSNVTVEGCKFTNAGRQAVEVRGTTKMYFNNNLVTAWGEVDTNGPAFGLQSVINDGIVISNNRFVNTVGDQFAIESAGAYTQNSVIMGNVFDANSLRAGGCSGYFRRTIFLANHHVNGVGSHRTGYEMIGNDIKVIGNTIESGAIVCTADDSDNIVDDLKPNGDTFLIQSNTVKSQATNQSCLYISGFTTGGADFAFARNVVVTGNTFDNRGATGNSAAVSIGFYGTNGYVSNVTFANNHIWTDTSQPAIRLRAHATNDEVRILNNVVYTGLNGIRIDDPGDWENVEIGGNDFRGVTSSMFVFGTGSFTDQFRVIGNIGPGQAYKALYLDSGHFILTGTGTPESAVTGNVGSLYIRTDGGAGTTVYIKETGTGNTGWAPIASIAGTATLSATQTFTGANTFNQTVGLEADAGGAIWNPSRGAALNVAALTSHSINASTNNIFLEATRPGNAATSAFRAWVDQSNNQVFLRSGNTDWHFLVNDNEVIRVFNTRNVHIQDQADIGTYTDNAAVLLAVNSTTQGFLPPRMTTTEKNAISTPPAGLIVYDTTLSKLCVRTASAWETITSA